jgi:hypothetical protein
MPWQKKSLGELLLRVVDIVLAVASLGVLVDLSLRYGYAGGKDNTPGIIAVS